MNKEKGIGYYNLQCRETYDILIKRLDKMMREKERNMNSEICCMALTVICIICIPMVLRRHEEEIAELKDARKFAQIRRDADGPDAALELPGALQKRLSHYRKKRSDGDGGGGGGVAYYDYTAYYALAAACGASGGYYDGG